MYSRNQYLQKLQEEYLGALKRVKGILLDEAKKRTGLTRKYLIRKLNPKTRWRKPPRKKRKAYYGGEVRTALARVWEILDYPCGQRLAPQLRETDIVDRLRKLGELNCSDEVEEKLKRIGSSAIDEKLRHQKEVLHLLQKKGQKQSSSLFLKKIPIKIHGELDSQKLGNIEIDFLEHCGQSAAGDFLCSLDTTDIASGWEEWEAIIGRGQLRTKQGLDRARDRYPFAWEEIHPDNDSGFINHHLYQYAQETDLGFSRSRPYKKNDNCYIEQKNWFSIRRRIGYLRFDTQAELKLLNSLYRNELRLYKNFFQTRMKLKEKIRVGSKVYRKYYPAKTPYHYLMESDQISSEKKQELKKIYLSLNPAQLKRAIEMKLDRLHQLYQLKMRAEDIKPFKKQRSFLVTKYTIQQQPFRLPTYTV